MSRSKRHHPICGTTTARSEKKDKRIANRRERHRIAAILGDNPEAELPHRKELSDTYDFDKDGKQIFDPEECPRKMNK